MSTTENTLAVATDTRLADLYGQAATIREGLARNAATIKQYAGATGRRGRYTMTLDEAEAIIAAPDFTPSSSVASWGRPGGTVDRAHENIDRVRGELAAINTEIAECEQTWQANGCWSRFFIVPAGHIHRNQSCSTCHNGHEPTDLRWLPELSGLTEADAVAAHGALLCTVCYPTAPAEWTNHYEAEAAAKKAAQCPGSGTYDYDKTTARLGYYTGNYGACEHCKQRVTVTKTNKLRTHKPATT